MLILAKSTLLCKKKNLKIKLRLKRKSLFQLTIINEKVNNNFMDIKKRYKVLLITNEPIYNHQYIIIDVFQFDREKKK